ncbi:MAG: hypothetical protein Kow0010_25050 [Dehalococcoidia bacterium]
MDRSRLERFVNQRLAEMPLADPLFVSPADPVSKAIRLMQEKGQSSVLSMEGTRLTGIFTERDVLTKCMVDGFDWEQPIGDAVLTRDPRVVQASATVADAIAIMQQHSYRTLPVMDGDRLLGLIRLGDLLRQLAEVYPEDVLNLPPRPHQVMPKREGG